MLKLKKKGLLIVVSGPSGTGKDSVCEKVVLENPNVWISVSCTSRPIRGGEIEGVNYFYLTRNEFEEKIKNGHFLEYAIYNDNYYGTPLDKIEEKLNQGIDVILVIDVQGAINVKKIYEDAVFIFILPPSMEELKLRLINRGTETEEKILERFKASYKEINEISRYNYVIINDNLSDAVNKMKSIIASERCRVDRIEEVELNTKEEVLHEALVDLNKH